MLASLLLTVSVRVGDVLVVEEDPNRDNRAAAYKRERERERESLRGEGRGGVMTQVGV